MKSVILSFGLCLLMSSTANAQHIPRDLDNIPVEKFEEPSEEFIYGTYYNTIRTLDEQTHSNYYGRCVVFVQELEDRSDPACVEVRNQVYASDITTKPTSHKDWAFMRQKFECGVYSYDLLKQMQSDEQPWGLFSEDDITLVQGAMKSQRVSFLLPRNPSDEDDPNRYECIHSDYTETVIPEDLWLSIQSGSRPLEFVHEGID